MSVRVVARIRPLLKVEKEVDIIVRASSTTNDSYNSAPTSLVRIPNPKNEGEDFSFQFNNVYDGQATQEDIFQAEVAPMLKSLFKGLDITLFAYGATGTGKTHTMRGGKTLAERGVIPRLLSGIYRRSRKIEKDSDGATTVQVAMSYYEIYNDRVYDLFEAPEKRTAAGLPIREQHGKTVVVGLTERPCVSLKEFEHLYDQANVNRSTSATKLNAHSSRSHAILCVKVSVMTDDEICVSTASAIDLAGSEDNRRTENGKDRLVESASINKSLFVLAQCVEAISKKQNRIPYRESKMTRILSLGQTSHTVMILNLAPIRSYHLETLSSLNFANRTKKIEVKEIENEPMFKGHTRAINPLAAATTHRQPLRPLANMENTALKPPDAAKDTKKLSKAFSVYADRNSPRTRLSGGVSGSGTQLPGAKKRNADAAFLSRPAKTARQTDTDRDQEKAATVSKADLEEMVERKVEEILAARVMTDSETGPIKAIGEEMQQRLELLEHKIEMKEDAKAEGLTYLLMAKQHHVRGEESSALKMYQLALPYFPNNRKLASKIVILQERLQARPNSKEPAPKPFASCDPKGIPAATTERLGSMKTSKPHDEAAIIHDGTVFEKSNNPEDDDHLQGKPRGRSMPASRIQVFREDERSRLPEANAAGTEDPELTPRARHVLHTINTRDIAQIKMLKGVGAKKAETIVDSLRQLDERSAMAKDNQDGRRVLSMTCLKQLGGLKGVGAKTVESMRHGVVID